EIFEEAAAAERLPADPQPAEHLAFIPHAALAQLDPGMDVGGKILDKLTEIDPVIGREIEDELVAVKGIFRINELHLKLVGGNPLFTGDKGRALIGTVLA